MSARRSRQSVAVKRFGRMAEQYQERISRQQHIIDKLMAANAVYGDLAYGIQAEAKDVRTARKWAKEAQEKVEAILAVPTEAQEEETA